VKVEVSTLSKMLCSETCGPFISKLMDHLLTKEQMSLMSVTGESCRANKNRMVTEKTAIPEYISEAIVGMDSSDSTAYRLILTSPIFRHLHQKIQHLQA